MRLAIGLTLLFALGAAAPAGAAAPRAEVPIRQTMLTNGRILYSIPIALGDAPPIEAWFDTQSTGLRLLPGAVAPGAYTLSNRKVSIAFGFATGPRIEYDGLVAQARIAIGGLPAPAPLDFEAVQSIALRPEPGQSVVLSCPPRRPNCPALTNEALANIKAIIGADLRPPRRFGLANPLTLLGDGQWIVILPRPGDAAPGRLILNPDADERAGYTLFGYGRRRGGFSLPACLVNGAGGEQICGAAVLDSGGVGISVLTPAAPASFPWAEGSEAEMVFTNAAQEKLTAPFRVAGVRLQPTSLFALPTPAQDLPPGAATFMNLGASPFFAFAVLYDAKNQTIGLKPRAP